MNKQEANELLKWANYESNMRVESYFKLKEIINSLVCKETMFMGESVEYWTDLQNYTKETGMDKLIRDNAIRKKYWAKIIEACPDCRKFLLEGSGGRL